MSGFCALSTFRGPPDENEVMRKYVVFGTVVALVDTAVVAATRLSPSAVAAGPSTPFTPRNGIVTVYSSPVSGFEVIFPSNGGKSAEVLIMTTATAPAFWPKIARATRAHVPRTVTTILPVAPAYSAGLQPRLTLPSGFRRTMIGVF